MAQETSSFNPLLEHPLPEAGGDGGLTPGSLALAGEALDAHRSYLERLQRVPQLICLDGPAEGAQVWGEVPQLRIGRGYNCHFVLKDPSVAPLHALMTRLPGGTYHLSSQAPDEAPLLVRRNGRLRPVMGIHLQDGMVVRLGKRGPRIRFRFLGAPDQTATLTRWMMALRYDEPLLPEPVLRERLGEVWRTASLQPGQRHTLQQALRYLTPLRFYRRWFYLWGLIGLLLAGVGVSRQLLLNDVRAELSTLKRQLASLWQGQTAGASDPGASNRSTSNRASDSSLLLQNNQNLSGGVRDLGGDLSANASGAQGIPGTTAGSATSGQPASSTPSVTTADGSLADTALSNAALSNAALSNAALSNTDEQALIQGDPIAQQVIRLMRSAGVQQPLLSLSMMRQIHSEIEKEVQRIKHRFEIDAFQARAQKFQPRIEDIFRREFQLPPMLATLAWLESDFRLDAESSDGSLGMWQLSEDVATEYGLITDQGEDFRMDFEASTRGSARYLTDLLTRFGLEQLPLVVAAFHLGPDVVENTLRKHQLWRQDQRTFPALLRLAGTGEADVLSLTQLQYVSRFFAVQVIAANQGYYLN